MRLFWGLAACAQLGTLWAQSYVISTVAGGRPAPATASATSVAIDLPGRVAVDPAGNVYFTALNSVFLLAGGKSPGWRETVRQAIPAMAAPRSVRN